MTEHVFRKLSSSGNKAGDGVVNAIGDYSSTPLSLKIVPEPGTSINIASMQLAIKQEQPGTEKTNFPPFGYGYNGPLANGIRIVKTRRGEIETDFTNGLPIKTTAAWERFLTEVQYQPEYVTGTWEFAKSGRLLHLQPFNAFELIFSDSFVPIELQVFSVQGYYSEAAI